jgi:hypothetical protein
VAVNLAQAVVYLAVWGWAVWHYLARVPGPHGVVAHVVIFAFSVPGLWYVFASARAHFTRRAVSDARVAVKKDGLHVGGEAQVRVEQDLLGEAAPERVRVGLVCEKITRSGKHTQRRVCFETWATPEPRPSPTRGRGRGLVFTETLSIPAGQPATRSDGDQRYQWKLVVDTALPDCPDYRETFELHVAPAADASHNDAMQPGAGRGKRGGRKRDVRGRKRQKE